MRCKVHYVSPKGCSEMVAEAIAGVCQCPKEPLLPAYMPENIALMFLGCEGTKADKITMEFINSMNKQRVQNAALFCAGGKGEAIDQMKKALEARGVNVLRKSFTAPCKGLFGGGPKPEDIQAAKKFAEECIAELSK